MATRSFALQGLDFVAAVSADTRLSHSEMIECLTFAVSLYREGATPDERATHAAEMMADALIGSRGSGRLSTIRAERFAWPNESAEPAREHAVKMSATEILKASARARGEITELPSNPVARFILRSHQRATNPDKPL
jgi:hypothetical protein